MGSIMAEEAKPPAASNPQPTSAETPVAAKPSHAVHAPAAAKPTRPKRVASPEDEWIAGYLAQAKADSNPRNFVGTIQVTEYVPHIRVAASSSRPAWIGKLWQALAVTLAGAVGLWLHRQRWPFSALEWLTMAAALGVMLFGLYRAVRPPLARLIADALINRIQLWDSHGRMRMINFVGCDYIELRERRSLRGFAHGIAVEPKLGATVWLARSRAGGRTEALLNTLELVRALVSITHLPVRLRPSRFTLGARLALPELAPTPTPAPPKPEDSPTHTGH